MNQESSMSLTRYFKNDVLQVALDIAAAEIDESFSEESGAETLLESVHNILAQALGSNKHEYTTAQNIERDAALIYGRYDHLVKNDHADSMAYQISSSALGGVLECLDDLKPVSLSKSPLAATTKAAHVAAVAVSDDGIFAMAKTVTQPPALPASIQTGTPESTQAVLCVEDIPETERNPTLPISVADDTPLATPPHENESAKIQRAPAAKPRAYLKPEQLLHPQPKQARHYQKPETVDAPEPAITARLVSALTKNNVTPTAITPTARYEISTIIHLGLKPLVGKAPPTVIDRLRRETNYAFTDQKTGLSGVTLADIQVALKKQDALKDTSSLRERAEVHQAVANVIRTAIATLHEADPIPERKERLHSYGPNFRASPTKPNEPKPATATNQKAPAKKAAKPAAHKKAEQSDISAAEAFTQLIALLNPQNEKRVLGISWLTPDGLNKVGSWTSGSRAVNFSHLRKAIDDAQVLDQVNGLIKSINTDLRVSAGSKITLPATSTAVHHELPKTPGFEMGA